MKLLLCRKCGDLFKLDNVLRSCKCGRVEGNYLPDGDRAVHNGKGVVLGIANGDLASLVAGVDCRVEVFLYPTGNGEITVTEELGEDL